MICTSHVDYISLLMVPWQFIFNAHSVKKKYYQEKSLYIWSPFVSWTFTSTKAEYSYTHTQLNPPIDSEHDTEKRNKGSWQGTVNRPDSILINKSKPQKINSTSTYVTLRRANRTRILARNQTFYSIAPAEINKWINSTPNHGNI